MPSQSGNHQSRYDDPYVFDDPYRHSTSPIGNTGYEYVGTDESPKPSKSRRALSPDPEPRRRPGTSRRSSRAASPPRYSRHDRAYSPPSKSDRRASPPRTSRHASPTRPSKKPHHSTHNKDKDSSQRPGVKRSKSFGQQGLKFLGEAAALYAATQGGRGRSQSRDDSHRGSHQSSEPRRHHHRHRNSPSPLPKGRSRAYSDDPPRRRRRHRSPSVSDDSDYGRDRGRHHRRSRASSYAESPSPRRHRGRHTKSASVSGRSRGRASSSKVVDEATTDRWQMAARAALEAGGLTAFRLRKDPGKWTGEKGAKIATAALGAAAIDAFIDKDPRRTKSSGMKGFAENTISSMIASKIMGFKGSTTRGGKSRY